MIHWLIYNFIVMLMSLFIILGVDSGIIVPLAWIILLVTLFLLVKWIGMVQWVVFNLIVLVTCTFVLLENSFGMTMSLLSPLAWILLIVTLALIAKDALFMRLR